VRQRSFFLLAVVLLLLAACAPASSGTQGTDAAPSAVVTDTAARKVILPNGLLPETAYTPPSPPPRYYEEITTKLLPRDDYGRLWPYVGGYVVQWWMPANIYGLCDEEGRIVCDPVYNRVEILEKDGMRLYLFTENLADEYGREVSKYTLSKLDGSWVGEYEDIAYRSYDREFMGETGYSWRQMLTYEYITVRQNGKWGVIDYEGREILPCVYNEPVCFSEGLAAVTSDDGETFSFIDVTGKVKLGPYNTPPQQKDEWDFTGAVLPRNHGMLFSEGLARFYEDGKYGVINKRGKVVVPAQYDFITSFYNGTAMIVTGKEGYGSPRGIIDSRGRVIYEPTNDWFYQTEDGTVVLDTPEGSFALDQKTGAKTPWENPIYATEPFYSQGPGGVVIHWSDGQQHFPNASNVVFLDNGHFALTNRDSQTWYITRRDGQTVAGPFDGRAEGFWDGLISVITGTSELRDGADSSYRTLYDRDGNRVLPEVYREIVPLDGHYLVRQDTYAGLLDEKGNWIIKVSILDYLND
jgi:hypothetical protein